VAREPGRKLWPTLLNPDGTGPIGAVMRRSLKMHGKKEGRKGGGAREREKERGFGLVEEEGGVEGREH
jgi:hypothetical protein